jgi:hypothetical protein
LNQTEDEILTGWKCGKSNCENGHELKCSLLDLPEILLLFVNRGEFEKKNRITFSEKLTVQSLSETSEYVLDNFVCYYGNKILGINLLLKFYFKY